MLWHCWLGDRKGIRPVKKLDVGLLVVTIWLELCTTYSSNCRHHYHHPLLQWTPANPGSPGKRPLKWRERLGNGQHILWSLKRENENCVCVKVCEKLTVLFVLSLLGTAYLVVILRLQASSWFLETARHCPSSCRVLTASRPCCRQPASGQVPWSPHWFVHCSYVYLRHGSIHFLSCASVSMLRVLLDVIYIC